MPDSVLTAPAQGTRRASATPKAILAAAVLLAATLPGTSFAHDEGASRARLLLPERLMIRAGGFAVRDVETRARLDSTQAPVGTFIDFDRSLGGDTAATVGRMDAYYRFATHHRVDLGYYRFNLDGRRVVSEQIDFGDQSFPINADIRSKLRLRVIKAAYTYSFYRNEDVELGVSAGLHTLGIEASLAEVTTGSRSESESVTAPLPTVGVLLNYRLSDNWTGLFKVESFFINLNDQFRGSLTDILLGAEYRVFKPFALGLAYNRFALNAEGTGKNSRLTIDHSWYGLLGYAAFFF